MTDKINFQYDYCLDKVIDEIENCIEDELHVEYLASICGYSHFHFQRLFKNYTGESIAKYVNRIRIEKSALILKYQHLNITDTAMRVGFNSNTSFTRAFKKYYNLSPKDYKEKYRIIDSIYDTPNFERVHIDDIKIFFYREFGNYSQSEPEAWRNLSKLYKNLIIPSTKYITICYNEPSITLNEKHLKYEACILYDENKHLSTNNIPTKFIKGGEYAKFEFEGTLNEFDNFFNIVYETFFHDKRFLISLKPAFQIHHNSFENLLFGITKTDLYIPLD